MTGPIRIRCIDRQGNVAYLVKALDGQVRCMLANGTPASLFYAGILTDEMACRFALEDCPTPESALVAVCRLGSPTHTYTLLVTSSVATSADLPAAAPSVSLGVYLRLFHGRRDPDEDLEEWGSEGPVIGPLSYVHVTYMSDIKFAASPDVMECFFPDVIGGWRAGGLSTAKAPRCDGRLDIEGDLILYDGVYYGDWSITSEPAPVALALSPR